MTWDQDQVDTFIKSHSWTNFEQKSFSMSTSTLKVNKEKGLTLRPRSNLLCVLFICASMDELGPCKAILFAPLTKVMFHCHGESVYSTHCKFYFVSGPLKETLNVKKVTMQKN